MSLACYPLEVMMRENQERNAAKPRRVPLKEKGPDKWAVIYREHMGQ